MKKYYFGIDIGGTSVKLGLFDGSCGLLEKWELRTRLESNGGFIIPDIGNSVRKRMKERRLDPGTVVGIGVGVPGQVDESGTVVLAENLGWKNVPLVQRLKEETGLPVKAENDANLAALGEFRMGSGKGCRSMMLVTLGTGVGCGIIVDGRILAGAHFAAGEIGHIHVNDRIQEQCSCGKYGCLEQLSSARGIVRIAQRILQEESARCENQKTTVRYGAKEKFALQGNVATDKKYLLQGDAVSEKISRLQGDAISAKNIFEAAGNGDALALRVAEEFGLYLGKALAMCACVVDPEVIVLGGGVSKAGDVLLGPAKRYYQKYAFLPCKNTEFRFAQLGNNAGIYGAARLMEKFSVPDAENV